jgi:NhaP-type Na+/H+ and K+/H+ antiporter
MLFLSASCPSKALPVKWGVLRPCVVCVVILAQMPMTAMKKDDPIIFNILGI